MYVLVSHPVHGLGVVKDGRFTPLGTAMSEIPEVANELLAEGDIKDGYTFYKDYAFTGKPGLLFWIVLPDRYPSELDVKRVYAVCEKYPIEVTDKQYNSFTLHTYTEELYNDIAADCAASHPDWIVRKYVPEVKTEPAPVSSLAALVPEECKGETWACTFDSVKPEDVTSDGYCIECNWENRDPYWIIDCVERGVRLIHSDALNVNKEIPLEACK